DQIATIIQQTDETLKLFQTSLRNVNDIVGDDESKRNLKDAFSEMPRLLKETREAMTGVQKTVALADSNLRNIQTFTKALDERGEGIIGNVAGSVDKLEQLLGQLNKFTRA